MCLGLFVETAFHNPWPDLIQSPVLTLNDFIALKSAFWHEFRDCILYSALLEIKQHWHGIENPPQHLIPFSGTQYFGGIWQVLLLVVNRWEIPGKTLRNTFGQFWRNTFGQSDAARALETELSLNSKILSSHCWWENWDKLTKFRIVPHFTLIANFKFCKFGYLHSISRHKSVLESNYFDHKFYDMETGNTNGSEFKTPKIVTVLPVKNDSALYGAVPRSVWRDPASKYFTAWRKRRYI